MARQRGASQAVWAPLSAAWLQASKGPENPLHRELPSQEVRGKGTRKIEEPEIRKSSES